MATTVIRPLSTETRGSASGVKRPFEQSSTHQELWTDMSAAGMQGLSFVAGLAASLYTVEQRTTAMFQHSGTLVRVVVAVPVSEHRSLRQEENA